MRLCLRLCWLRLCMRGWWKINDKTFPPSPGIYKFERQENGGKSRIHLRLENDFSGILVVNASKMIHLNLTAGIMAWQYLTQVSEKKPSSNLQCSLISAIKELNKIILKPANVLKLSFQPN